MTPSQPSTATYGAAALNLFPETTRADHPETPTYDPSKKTKTWVDPDALSKADANGNVTYKALAALQPDPKNPVWTKFSMAVAEALALNLYGIHSYPMPTPPAPSGVTAAGSVVDAKYLCTKVEAQALMTLLQSAGANVGNLAEDRGNAIFPYKYAAGETRGVWNLTFTSSAGAVAVLNAAVLIAEMGANGIGAPGHWNLDGPEPNWISDIPSSLPPANPSWPVPQRDLLPNEAIQVTLIGWEIVRTDLISQGSGSSSGGGLTAAQDKSLSNTERLAVAIAARYGIS